MRMLNVGRTLNWGSAAAVILLTLVLVALGAQALWAQAGLLGQWATLPYLMPINPIHLALLNTGKVLVVAGSGNVAAETNFRSAVWDPQAGTIAVTQGMAWDMFCNGMVVLPDGRAFINGGTLQYDPFYGQRRNSVYDPATGLFADVQNMAHGRWYPTVTTLGDGRVMTFSGLSETGGTNTTVEIYTAGSGWSQEYPAGWTPPLYPRMHVLPDGTVFYSGAGTGSRIFNPSTKAWSGVVASTNYPNTRTYGTSVLLPLTPANGYKPRVMIMGGGNPATATTEIIDLSTSPPHWQYGPSMSQPRIEMNATILPNGKVLAVGGSTNDEDTTTASLNADLYDSNTNSFSSAGHNAFPRLYHSGSMLLPDATVLVVCGNPTRGSYEAHIEVYSPAYLFNADGSPAVRPTISGVSSSALSYGGAFQVQTPQAANITSVVLMRPGAPTHAFDMDQRLVGLSFTAGAGVLNVTAPPNGNIAPPGYYMLFVLNSAGVPALARFLHLSATPSAPTNLAANAASASQINLTWTASTGNVTSYLIERCLGAGCTNFAQIGTSTSASYSDTLLAASTTYSYRVRATDGTYLSGYSNVASATTLPSTTPPTPPSNLTATAAASTQINLSWTASTGGAGVTGYFVERCQGAGCSSFSQIASPTGTSYNDTNLLAATSYSYRVRATDTASNLSGYSNVATATTPANSGLVAAYSFNEGTGTTVADSSGNANTGTLSNATWTTAGKYGKALVFNGSSSVVTINDSSSLHLTTGMTVEAWVNPTALQGAAWIDVIYKQTDIYQLAASSTVGGEGPTAGGTFGNGWQNVAGPSALAVNSWTHLAMTFDGANLRVWINGVNVASQPQTSPLTTSTMPLQIGGDSIYGQYFTGTIDEIRIYNRALSQTEIQADMNSPIGSGGATPPTAPANLTATASGGTQINLTWSASTSSIGIANYPVERCQGAGCTNFVQIATPTTTSYSDTGLTSAVTYSYRVRAADTNGVLSAYSNTASGTTADIIPPTAPSNLTAAAVSSSQVNLSWTASTDNVGVTGYRLERCQGAGCTTFAQIAPPTATTYSNTGLTAGTSYSYRVRATDAAGNLSGYSNVATATTPVPDTTPPTAPSNLTATASGSSGINLSWTASTDNVGVTGYFVERCQGAGCATFAQIASPTGTSYADTGLTAGTSYSYRVRATDAAGNLSGYSNVASATTAASSGLVAAYSFKEGTGTTVIDSSGNGNTGTISGATWTASGKYGNALVFNGRSSIVTINDSPSLHLTTGMTVEAWVNPTALQGAAWIDVIYKQTDIYQLAASSTIDGEGPTAGGTFGNGWQNVAAPSALAVNSWTHLAMTFDGGNLTVWVNGVNVASQAQTSPLTTSSMPLQIGGDSIYGQYFTGTIDEVRIYNRALSQNEIQADMNSPIG
jgi:fibronectin type 3 domain-containing protein